MTSDPPSFTTRVLRVEEPFGYEHGAHRFAPIFSSLEVELASAGTWFDRLRSAFAAATLRRHAFEQFLYDSFSAAFAKVGASHVDEFVETRVSLTQLRERIVQYQGDALIVARTGERGGFQYGNAAFSFPLGTLHTLRVSRGQPAKGPGGYFLELEFVSALGAGPDVNPHELESFEVPVAQSDTTTLDLLRIAMQIAGFFGARFAFAEWSDV